jgi:hypothetical protein
MGDTHGFTQDTIRVLNKMGERKITHVFVVGDFGLWTHKAEGHEFLDMVNAAAEANNLSVFAVGGNHENWDHWEVFCEIMPKHKGFAMVRRRVLLAPKVHEFRLAGKQFVVAGGAVSIDKDYRLEQERGGNWGPMNRFVPGSGERTLWWPGEELTDEDVAVVKSMRFPNTDHADVLLTHDCSNYTLFDRGRLKPDAASERHRQRIDKVIAAVKPEVHFHGHMHTKYEWENTLSHGDSAFMEEEWTGPVTRTYGMECNPGAMWEYSRGDWWGVLDTDTMEFAYQGENMQFRSLAV